MHYLTEAVYTRAVSAIVKAAERAHSALLGWVPCDFPHEALAPEYLGGPFPKCPYCKAAV